MNYAKQTDGGWSLIPRPRWYVDDEGQAGEPVSDEVLADHDIYPVQHERPEHDPEAEFLVRDDPSQWTLIDGVVVVGYSVASYDPSEIWQRRRQGAIDERVRRLAGGFDFDFGDARGVVRIGTTEQDMVGWKDVGDWSTAALALGQPGATMEIVPSATPVTITALEWQQIIVAGAVFRQPIWAASFALQAMNPIPADYTDDIYWSAL